MLKFEIKNNILNLRYILFDVIQKALIYECTNPKIITMSIYKENYKTTMRYGLGTKGDERTYIISY